MSETNLLCHSFSYAADFNYRVIIGVIKRVLVPSDRISSSQQSESFSLVETRDSLSLITVQF